MESNLDGPLVDELAAAILRRPEKGISAPFNA